MDISVGTTADRMQSGRTAAADQNHSLTETFGRVLATPHSDGVCGNELARSLAIDESANLVMANWLYKRNSRRSIFRRRNIEQ
jgi:hypothetical protein